MIKVKKAKDKKKLVLPLAFEVSLDFWWFFSKDLVFLGLIF
jgi:hypothetical protein